MRVRITTGDIQTNKNVVAPLTETGVGMLERAKGKLAMSGCLVVIVVALGILWLVIR